MIAAILLAQGTCAIFFVSDIVIGLLGLPVGPINWQIYEFIQLGAALGLLLGLVLGAITLRRALRQTARAHEKLRAASGAFMEVLEERFTDWGLTPAERDVALFAIKGMSTQEIATLRSTSEGTVKAQTNAIYRKAGVAGRPQLLSVFIDELMGDGLAPATKARSTEAANGAALTQLSATDAIADAAGEPASAAEPGGQRQASQG